MRGTSSDSAWKRMTTSDNKWYNEWQRMTTSDNEWQRVVQPVTTNDNERRQPVAISANSSFFQVREESTTEHPKENFLNFEDDLEEKRNIELRVEGSRWEILTVRSRNCRNSCLQIFLKIGALKIFAIFTEKPFVKVSFNAVAGLQACACNSIKKRPQRRCFPVNIVKFFHGTPLAAASAIETFV